MDPRKLEKKRRSPKAHPFSQQPNRIKKAQNTKIINWDSSIAEPPGGLVGVKISSIRKAIRASQGAEEVVVAAVHRGVTNDEEGWNQRRRRRSWGWRRSHQWWRSWWSRRHWRGIGIGVWEELFGFLRVLPSFWLKKHGGNQNAVEEYGRVDQHCRERTQREKKNWIWRVRYTVEFVEKVQKHPWKCNKVSVNSLYYHYKNCFVLSPDATSNWYYGRVRLLTLCHVCIFFYCIDMYFKFILLPCILIQFFCIWSIYLQLIWLICINSLYIFKD